MIQSTDKNFLVPVGGAILASTSSTLLKEVSNLYPGRASSAPIVDLCVTLLSMGVDGYQKLLETRREILLPTFQREIRRVLEKYQLQILPSPENTISFAIGIDRLIDCTADNQNSNNNSHTDNSTNIDVSNTNDTDNSPMRVIKRDLTFLGAMLFQRNISGCRVVTRNPSKVTSISSSSCRAPYQFRNWGAHNDQYPYSYLTVACAIGMEVEEVHTFVTKFDKTLAKFLRLSKFIQDNPSDVTEMTTTTTTIAAAATTTSTNTSSNL